MYAPHLIPPYYRAGYGNDAVQPGCGHDMSKGMAIVIIGGLTYATLMTLFIVPVMYDLFTAGRQ